MRILLLASAVLLVAASASADMSPPTPPPSTPSSVPESRNAERTPREEAELSYANAYEEIGKAKKEAEKGKAKNATKRYRKALEEAERATEYDKTYHEAWNLVGYAARNLQDYKKSVSAYERSLELKFDYAPAREYLGETHLAMGNLKGAREQLVMLEKLKATTEHTNLKTAIDTWVAAHPEAEASDAVAVPSEATPTEAAAPAAGGSKP